MNNEILVKYSNNYFRIFKGNSKYFHIKPSDVKLKQYVYINLLKNIWQIKMNCFKVWFIQEKDLQLRFEALLCLGFRFRLYFHLRR